VKIDPLDHLDLVRKVARRFRTCQVVDREDLEQAGFLGLLDACARFDASAGAKFSTYASLRVRGAIVDWLRQARLTGKAGREVIWAMSIESPLPGREKGIVSDGIAEQRGPTEAENSLEAAELFEVLSRGLSRRELRIAVARYLDGRSVPQIARRLRLTQSRVYQLMRGIDDQLMQAARAHGFAMPAGRIRFVQERARSAEHGRKISEALRRHYAQRKAASAA
jgi:RNA polymerase sigma factor (sigma-70 family)